MINVDFNQQEKAKNGRKVNIKCNQMVVNGLFQANNSYLHLLSSNVGNVVIS